MSAWNCWKDTTQEATALSHITASRLVAHIRADMYRQVSLQLELKDHRCGQPLRRRMPPALTLRDPTPLAFEEEDKDWPW